MTGSLDCREIRPALGVYVLGAIDPAERSLVDLHLGTCPECREELAGLASLPALLRRVPVAEAQELADEGDTALPGTEPSELMLRSLLSRTRAVRRARRWRGLAAAAAVVLVAGLGGAAGYGALHGAGAPGAAGGGAAASATSSWDSARASDPATQVTAVIRYSSRPWGTALDTQVTHVPAGAHCQLVVTDTAGRTAVVGSWTASYDQNSTWYPGATSVALASVRSFAVTAGGKVLVSVPVHGS
jgi:anti-sigma factor RsiW